ncbi:MAG: hypothetical protein ACTSR8_06070 [Promethearchaeota archaeon]
MNFKESLNNFKNFVNPSKNEHIFLISLVILFFFLYYDALLDFPKLGEVYIYLIIMFIIYIGLFTLIYLYFRQKVQNIEFQNQFYLFTQLFLTLFLGISVCIFYLSIQTNEIIIFAIALIPLLFFILIIIIHNILIVQVNRFLRWVLKDEIWNQLDEQTRKDFRQAERSIRSENIANAILNVSKGLERELKLAIFEPFKHELEKHPDPSPYFRLIKPFKQDGSDPRQRTYENFKHYLQGNRHLTFGNIPFFLLNLSDNKIGQYTPLFSEFSKFLEKRYGGNFPNINKISRILFNHDYFTVPGIKISDLRNEAAHPQKRLSNGQPTKRANDILSMENYTTLIKVLAIRPNLLHLILSLKNSDIGS